MFGISAQSRAALSDLFSCAVCCVFLLIVLKNMFQVDFYVQVIYRNAYKFHFQVGGEIVIYAFEQQTSYGFAGNFSPLPQHLAKENSNHKKVPLTRKQPKDSSDRLFPYSSRIKFATIYSPSTSSNHFTQQNIQSFFEILIYLAEKFLPKFFHLSSTFYFSYNYTSELFSYQIIIFAL